MRKKVWLPATQRLPRQKATMISLDRQTGRAVVVVPSGQEIAYEASRLQYRSWWQRR